MECIESAYDLGPADLLKDLSDMLVTLNNHFGWAEGEVDAGILRLMGHVENLLLDTHVLAYTHA